jgi:hypothetical protein
LLLTLAVHNPQGRQLATMFADWAAKGNAFYLAIHTNLPAYLSTSELRPTIKSASTTLSNVATALNSRFEGALEDPTDTGYKAEKRDQRGSLPYRLKESHSTSCRVLHPEVKAFLQRMMG